MKYAIYSSLAALFLASVAFADGKPNQFPTPPQFPPLRPEVVNDGWQDWFTETLKPGEVHRYHSDWANSRPIEFRVVSMYDKVIITSEKVVAVTPTYFVTATNRMNNAEHFTVQFRYTDQRATSTTPGCETGCNCSVTGVCTCADCPNSGGKQGMVSRPVERTTPTYTYSAPQTMYYGGRSFGSGGSCSGGSCR